MFHVNIDKSHLYDIINVGGGCATQAPEGRAMSADK